HCVCRVLDVDRACGQRGPGRTSRDITMRFRSRMRMARARPREMRRAFLFSSVQRRYARASGRWILRGLFDEPSVALGAFDEARATTWLNEHVQRTEADYRAANPEYASGTLDVEE